MAVSTNQTPARDRVPGGNEMLRQCATRDPQNCAASSRAAGQKIAVVLIACKTALITSARLYADPEESHTVRGKIVTRVPTRTRRK